MAKDIPFGPAMMALTEKQRGFVLAYFATGKREAAAHAAGYAGPPGGNQIEVAAHRVWHHPKVQEAMREYAATAMVEALPLAVKAMTDIVQVGEPKDRLKAAQMISERAGLHAVTEQRVVVSHEDRMDRIKRLTQRAQELGVDPTRLIGQAIDFTDAKFEVVTPTADVPAADPPEPNLADDIKW